MLLNPQSCAVHRPAPQMSGINMGHSHLAELTVTFASPHRIRYASQTWLDMMGLSCMQTTGRSLGLVHGPSTDVVTINSLIKAAALGCVQSAATALYTREGDSILMRITAVPIPDDEADGTPVCRLLMEPSDAVPVKMGLADDNGLPKVVLSAVAPHVILSASLSFTALYGVSETQILGRTMNFMHGPLSDVRLWNAMLKNALTGQAQSASMWTCSSDCSEFIVETTTTPAFGQDGRITHIIVNLSVPPPPNMTSMEEDEHFAQQNNTMFISDEAIMGQQQQQFAPHHFHRQQQQEQQHSAHFEQQQNMSHPPAHQEYRMESFPAQQQHNFASHTHALPEPCMMHQQQPAPMQAWDSNNFATLHQQQQMQMGAPQHAMAPEPNAQDQWASLAMQESNMWGPGGPADLGMQQFEHHGVGIAVSRASSQPGTPSSPNDCMTDSSCSAIFPRRKAGQHRKDGQGPVFITLEVLESMAEVPLSDAAKQLGVSTTAMKKACRKLGVQRWPYRKHGESGQQVELLSHYNDAYVRKLFRKYSPKVPKVKSPKSPKAESDTEVVKKTAAVKQEAVQAPSAPASAGALPRKVQVDVSEDLGRSSSSEQEWGSCFGDLDGSWGMPGQQGELMIASGYDLGDDRSVPWMQCLP